MEVDNSPNRVENPALGERASEVRPSTGRSFLCMVWTFVYWRACSLAIILPVGCPDSFLNFLMSEWMPLKLVSKSSRNPLGIIDGWVSIIRLNSFTRFWLWRSLKTFANFGLCTTYSYDLNGSTTKVLLWSGSPTSYTWDAAIRLSLIQLPTGYRYTQTYRYDDLCYS